MQSNRKEQMLHSPPLLLPHLQELSASEAALTLLLFRPRKEHPTDSKGKVLISSDVRDRTAHGHEELQ